MNYFTTMPSDMGDVTIQASDKGIKGIWFEMHTTMPSTLGTRADAHPILARAVQQLQEYFAAKRDSFDLPIDVDGTPFQKSVWNALRNIPYGKTCSYTEIAHAIGKPKAVRAVGAANGKNPVSIVVPCHRVIGANGRLTGYAGGLDVKIRLLNLENIAQN